MRRGSLAGRRENESRRTKVKASSRKAGSPRQRPGVPSPPQQDFDGEDSLALMNGSVPVDVFESAQFPSNGSFGGKENYGLGWLKD